jgi:hypothetical protein
MTRPAERQRFAISVSREDHELISGLAQRLGMTRSDVVREAVAGFVLIRDLNEQLARKEIRPWLAPYSPSQGSPSRRPRHFGPSSMIGGSDEQSGIDSAG